MAIVVGIAACLLALGEATAGALLSRRSTGPARFQRPLVVLYWTSALATLSLGVSYLRFQEGMPFEGAWRGAFVAMFAIAAALHLALEFALPADPRNLGRALVGYGVAGVVAALGWGTDLWFERVTSLVPFSFEPGPGFPFLLWTSVIILLAVAGSMFLAWHRLPRPARRRTAGLVWGIGGTSLLAAFLQWIQYAVTVDAFLSLMAASVLLFTVPWQVSARGLFASSVGLGAFGLVSLWIGGLAVVQAILFGVLSPPLPPLVAVPVTMFAVSLVGYLVLPASRRTLDSVDALLLARRRGRRLLESFLARLGTTLDPRFIAGTTVDFLVRDYGFSWARCYLVAADGRFQGIPESEDEEGTVPLDPSDLRSMAGSLIWVSPEVPSSPRGLRSGPETSLERTGAHAALILAREGEVHGLVLAGPLASGAELEDRDRDLLRSLAVHLSVVLQNARNFEAATTDSLTGLLQRGYLLKRLQEEIDREARHHRGLTVMMVDIDHFKQVNDRFGHPEGDRVLQEVARRLRSNLRSSDLAGRYGGEEFLLVLPDTPGETSRGVAERLRSAVQASPVGLAGRVTVSIGVARWRGHGTLEALIQQADLALYRAKRGGRNRVEFHGGSRTGGDPSS